MMIFAAIFAGKTGDNCHMRAGVHNQRLHLRRVSKLNQNIVVTEIRRALEDHDDSFKKIGQIKNNQKTAQNSTLSLTSVI